VQELGQVLILVLEQELVEVKVLNID